MFSQIKDRKHIEHSVARVMPRGGTWGCFGESKTLAWGFAMVPHRLRALVFFLHPSRNSRQLICCFDSDNLLRFTKLVKCIHEFSYITVFVKIRNIISKKRRSKVTDFAALWKMTI